MTINWEQFAPWTALEGGLLVGIAAALLLLFNGRIAGISGIFGGLFNTSTKDRAWRLAFVAGLILSPIFWKLFGQLPSTKIDAGFTVIAIAGFLVGLGTRFASGCTSGHGVCGLSRLSPRSLIATLLFMGAGICTVFIARHLLGASV